jgi:hypothetical protein
MNDVEKALCEASEALAAARSESQQDGLVAMSRFMQHVGHLAQLVARQETSWEVLRGWAGEHTEALRAARRALQAWDLVLGSLIYEGDEEQVEDALDKRSQRAFARELFHGTLAEEMLQAFDDDGVDRDLRARADAYFFDGPSWVPRTHTWWRWRADA